MQNKIWSWLTDLMLSFWFCNFWNRRLCVKYIYMYICEFSLVIFIEHDTRQLDLVDPLGQGGDNNYLSIVILLMRITIRPPGSSSKSLTVLTGWPGLPPIQSVSPSNGRHPHVELGLLLPILLGSTDICGHCKPTLRMRRWYDCIIDLPKPKPFTVILHKIGSKQPSVTGP